MFYVCSECGDIGCGAITGLITEAVDVMIWSDFAYEFKDYSAPDEPIVYQWFRDVGPFRFDRNEYRQVLADLKRDVIAP